MMILLFDVYCLNLELQLKLLLTRQHNKNSCRQDLRSVFLKLTRPNHLNKLNITSTTNGKCMHAEVKCLYYLLHA